MVLRQKVYFPPRSLWQGKLFENPISQLAHSGQLEDVNVEIYDVRRVKGWKVTRPNGEVVLIVNKKTSANPYQAVLHLPGISTLPETAQQVSSYQWSQPRPNAIDDEFDGTALASAVCASWTDCFSFLEEKYADDVLIRAGLRAPQIGAVFASLAHWKVSTEVGTLVMPTGTGKTETMLALLAKEALGRLLVIVPNNALRDQVAEKFQTFGVLQKSGVIGSDAQLPVVGRMKHSFKTPDNAKVFFNSCNAVIATMSAVNTCSEQVQDAIASTCTHLFIDEAHHVPAPSWNAFRDRFLKLGKPILQFTATPYRRDGKHVGGRSIYTYPLKKAQEQGFFTPITFVPVWEYDASRADLLVAERAVQLLNDDRANEFDHLLMARTRSIERARQVHAIYTNLAPEFAPLVVHSEQNDQDRSRAIEEIRERRSRIIVCVDMLGEGFDLPQLKIAALHDVHKSLAVTIQFIGRFTRSAHGLGEAKVVANAADAQVEDALEDLYAKDSDWNFVLRRLSEGATGRQRRVSDFLEGFTTSPLSIPLQNISPKMSTVVYKTSCVDWTPEAARKFFEDIDLLLEPTLNPKERALLLITREQFDVVWGETKAVHDIVHNLYLAHWDEEQKLLFINSTDNSTTHEDFARVLAGGDVELIRGEVVYRTLSGVKRLLLSTLGLKHRLNRAAQFTMHVGTDVKEGLSRPNIINRTKSNLFGRGYEQSESVTIGASYKGRIWSQRAALDISDWIHWCQHIGRKLKDETIETKEVIDGAIKLEQIEERPALIPLSIEWPIEFFERNDEYITLEIADRNVPFYEAELGISEFTSTGPLSFYVGIDEARVAYEMFFTKVAVEYRRKGAIEVFIKIGKQSKTLTDWFRQFHPTVIFDDTSQLEYNTIARPNSDVEPYNSSKIEGWEWLGIDLKKESQYKKLKNPTRLEFRSNSIQRRVIEVLLSSDADYDVIFDDDDSGEIADIVALKVMEENLHVHLFHCKYSRSSTAGARVEDFYHVCGQAQKSVGWHDRVATLFQHLKRRHLRRQNLYGERRFERGDVTKLEELRRKHKELVIKFHIYIVQPGLSVQGVDSDILNLLGATELYLMETHAIPLKVIGSAGSN